MKNKIVQCAFIGAVAGIVIYLVRKKIIDDSKRKAAMRKEEDLARKQRRKFSEAYGEYTL